MTPGTVFFDEEFEFHDGNQGRKLFVVLGSNDHYMVVAKTTSQGHHYALSYGCQASNRFPAFFIPHGACFLSKPTWICLDEFYELKNRKLIERMLMGKIRRMGELGAPISEEIMLCAIQSDDITSAQETLVNESLKALGQ